MNEGDRPSIADPFMFVHTRGGLAMPERFISPLRKAWVSPDGEVHEFEFGHHEQWLHKNRDEFPKDVLGIARGMSIHAAEKAGWYVLPGAEKR